jgi:pimeloyl-ACP methyl ester carboxylesterase
VPGVLSSYDDWCAGGDRRSDLSGVDGAVYTRTEGPVGGAPLTLLHGFPTSSHDWVAVLPALTAAGFRVTMLDFLGFGDSDKPADHRYSLTEQADIVEAIWAADGIESTALVAHDYGVSVAQELLARRSERITSMTWLNGGIYPDLHRPTAGQELLHSDAGQELAQHFTADLFATSIREVFGRTVGDDDVQQMWLALHRRDGQLRAPALLRYIDDRRDNVMRWTGAIESYAGPQTFIWGPADPVSGGHVLPRIRECVPGAQVHVLDDPPPVGHYPQVEAPELVAPLLVAAASRTG